MNIYVSLIIQPSFDWPSFLRTTKESLGRSVTKELDSRRQDVQTPLGFVGCLGSMAEIPEPQGDLSLLRHLTYGFQVITDTDTLSELLRRTTGLSVVTAPTTRKNVELSVITATLDTWLVAIASCTTGNESFELRYLFDSVMLTFETIGFHRMFLKWKKESVPDGTFRLLEN